MKRGSDFSELGYVTAVMYKNNLKDEIKLSKFNLFFFLEMYVFIDRNCIIW